ADLVIVRVDRPGRHREAVALAGLQDVGAGAAPLRHADERNRPRLHQRGDGERGARLGHCDALYADAVPRLRTLWPQRPLPRLRGKDRERALSPPLSREREQTETVAAFVITRPNVNPRCGSAGA